MRLVSTSSHLTSRRQVSLFVGCPRAFFEALVCKLQPCICIAGDYVFYKGELGASMYFMRRGVAEVCSQGVVLATLYAPRARGGKEGRAAHAPHEKPIRTFLGALAWQARGRLLW